MDDYDFDFEDFVSPIKEAAFAMHDMYLNFIEAGFTEKQSFELIARLFAVTVEMTKKDEDEDE